MNASTQVLLAEILLFWGAWLVLALSTRRSWIPVIPIYPGALLLAGLALNCVCAWMGTLAIAALHVGLIAMMVWQLLRRR